MAEASRALGQILAMRKRVTKLWQLSEALFMEQSDHNWIVC